MTRRPTDVETAQITLTLSKLLWIAGGLVVLASSWSIVAVRKLDSIDSRLEALQKSGWTIQDQERQMNWLQWDNTSIQLKVRDTRDVVKARTPNESLN